MRKRDQRVRDLAEAVLRVLNGLQGHRATLCALERRLSHLEQFQHGHCIKCGWPTDSVTILECPPPVCKGRKAA